MAPTTGLLMPRKDDDILRFDADQIERLGPEPTRPPVEPRAPTPPPASDSHRYPGPVPRPTPGATGSPAVPSAPAIPWKFLLGSLAGAAVTAGMAYLMRNLNDFTEAQEQSAPRKRSRRRRRRRKRKRQARQRKTQNS